MRQVLQFRLHQRLNLPAVDTQLLKEIGTYILPFVHDAKEQVHRLDGLLLVLLGCKQSLLNGLLCLNCEFV